MCLLCCGAFPSSVFCLTAASKMSNLALIGDISLMLHYVVAIFIPAVPSLALEVVSLGRTAAVMNRSLVAGPRVGRVV